MSKAELLSPGRYRLMPAASKFSSLLLALWVISVAVPATGGARAYRTQATPAGKQVANSQEPNPKSNEADTLNAGSALKAMQATMRQSGYTGAPVSQLRLNDRPPDLVFQKSLNTFAKRHHIRIWKLAKKYNGRGLWVGAATHDIATSNSRAGTKWSHRIDPHIDRERDWIETDLLFVGSATAYADVERPAAPRKAGNATGDDIVTDGKMSVVELATMTVPSRDAAWPVLTPRK